MNSNLDDPTNGLLTPTLSEVHDVIAGCLKFRMAELEFRKRDLLTIQDWYEKHKESVPAEVLVLIAHTLREYNIPNFNWFYKCPEIRPEDRPTSN